VATPSCKKSNPSVKKAPGRPRKNASAAVPESLGGPIIVNNPQTNIAQPLQETPRQTVKAVGLLLDVKTRWNSCYLMLQRFYDLMFAVTMFYSRIAQSGENSLEKCKIFDFEWERVKNILELMIATVRLSTSKFPSLSTTLPIYMGLIKVSIF
jgi:hypothetical protein